MPRINDEVREELEQILLRDGVLTEKAVVEAARNETSALHEHFEWDPSRAHEKYLHEQARRLIVRVKVTIEDRNHEEVKVRGYYSLPSDRKAGGGYRSTPRVLSNEEQRAELLAQAASELAAFEAKYQRLAGTELGPVLGAARRFLDAFKPAREERAQA